MSADIANPQLSRTEKTPNEDLSSGTNPYHFPQPPSISTTFTVKSTLVQAPPEPEQLLKQQLEEERERRKKRAERFKTEFIEPKKTDLLLQPISGFDVLVSNDETKLPKSKKFSFLTVGKTLNVNNENAVVNAYTSRKRSLNTNAWHANTHHTVRQEELGMSCDTHTIEEQGHGGVDHIAPTDSRVVHTRLPTVFEEPPAPFDRTAMLRPEVLYVCNTEQLTRDAVCTYFALYGVHSIERLSKSSCNVVFSNGEVVKRVLEECGKPVVFNGETNVWFAARRQVHGGPALFRIATSRDVPKTTTPLHSPTETTVLVTFSRRKNAIPRRQRRETTEGNRIRQSALLDKRIQGGRVQKPRRHDSLRLFFDERERFELDIRQLKDAPSERIQQRIQRFAAILQLQHSSNSTSPSTADHRSFNDGKIASQQTPNVVTEPTVVSRQ
jgi:hypothetical protein